MLVISRKAGQAVYFDRHIKVTVLQIKGNQIRLGLEAPKNISIYRDNCKNIIKESENQAKDGTSTEDFS